MKRLLALLMRLWPVTLHGQKPATLGADDDMQRLRDALERQIAADDKRGRRG